MECPAELLPCRRLWSGRLFSNSLSGSCALLLKNPWDVRYAEAHIAIYHSAGGD